MSAVSYGYFDEAYFQDGTQRGTAYVNYRESARSSKTFQELAAAIQEVFQPRRVLDVGCATGAVVRHLNEIGCEAHGVDVSEWAVQNAEHPNVRLASADALPYPDGYFDLVISCHSMEHLPDAVFHRSLQEIVRVGSAFQFHMLPMIGTPPYDGEPETVRRELRKDPTHQQLHAKDYWVNQFKRLGCAEVVTCILLRNETANAELSTGQFVLCKPGIDDSGMLGRSRSRNQRIFRELQLDQARQRQALLNKALAGKLILQDKIWKDVERKLLGETIDLTGRTIRAVIIAEGSHCALRFAAGQDVGSMQYAHVGELQMPVQPGCNIFSFTTDQLRTLRGQPDYSAVNHLAIGGTSEKADLTIFLGDQSEQRPLF
jgi:SAM-dependent methyltransferase